MKHFAILLFGPLWRFLQSLWQWRFDRLVLLIAGCFLIMGAVMLLNPLERGIMVSFYDNTEWQGSPLTTLQRSTIELASMQFILPKLQRDFSVLWEGFLWISQSGEYAFTTLSDDGSDVYVDDRKIINNGGFHTAQEKTGNVYLEKGYHRFVVRYMQGKGLSIFSCYWSPPGQRRTPLPAKYLFVEPGTTKAYVFGRWCEIVLAICKALCVFLVLGWFGIRYYNGTFSVPKFKQSTVVIMIILLVFMGHFWWSKISLSIDSIWSTYVALSVLREGNLNLDEYERVLQFYSIHYVELEDGHYYDQYPFGTPLMAMPIMWVVDHFMEHAFSLDLVRYYNTYFWAPRGIEKFIASWIVAFASALMYLLACLFFERRVAPLVLTFIFAFCTSTWSTASRGLWQHGPALLILTLSLYLLVLAEKQPQHTYWAIRLMAVCLSFSFWIRPTNAFSILFLTGYIFWYHRQHVFSYVLYGVVAALPFFIVNLAVYHRFTSHYYQMQQLTLGSSRFWEGLVGTLMSPSRGVFIYSPVLLFAFYGIFLKIKKKQMVMLDMALVAIVVFHWIVSSAHPAWWGGHSYGPRYFTEMTVYFVYFLIPIFLHLPLIHGLRKIMLISLLCCSISFSFFVHYRGAMSREVNAWSAYPVDVAKDPSRLWDWSDIQFLRGLRRGN